MSNGSDRSSFSPDDIPEAFWQIVSRANRDREQLRANLSQMSREEIIWFQHQFEEAATQLADEPFTSSMAIPSEDGARDIAEWVVSQGKEAYSQIWSDPGQFPALLPQRTQSTFSSVADDVFWERFNAPIPADAI